TQRLDRNELAESGRPVGAADIDGADAAAPDLGQQPVASPLRKLQGWATPGELAAPVRVCFPSHMPSVDQPGARRSQRAPKARLGGVGGYLLIITCRA